MRSLAARQIAETRATAAAELARTTQTLLDNADRRLRDSFQALAADALKDNRSSFLDLAKTSFEDIARRASLSRTLLYRMFKDKEDIYRAVFADWLLSRRPAVKEAANGPGSAYQRLLRVCRLIVLEPWAEMVQGADGR